MSRLPTSADALVGLRAARWIRESTTGQFDRYGPEAQIELQDASIRRLGLVDTGLVWTAAHSGRTVSFTGTAGDPRAEDRRQDTRTSVGPDLDARMGSWLCRFSHGPTGVCG